MVFTLCLIWAKAGLVVALRATSLVRLLMLYGYFIEFSSKETAGVEKQIPSRIPASPNALDKVCKTTRFGYLFTRTETELPTLQKSTYASSIMTNPFHSAFSTFFKRSSTRSSLICAAVGLPGDVT
ncbi:hypothetical protein OGAPHI_005655 [Ogataea philodendri]|uniref:Uncharacterized protein n=1 Tax=Ogataea philodendri TaxID=1378263 RepID=A0A9P8T148_9ASCO|nr:uncharacterized protein OGAPHI_005655 [Ogataea philodendri]KAH3662403.1 hypothetical protein OGAPHI_005655 [Ogataea philodendri]